MPMASRVTCCQRGVAYQSIPKELCRGLLYKALLWISATSNLKGLYLNYPIIFIAV